MRPTRRAMRIQAIHTCPLWEESDGTRRVGFEEEEDHPPVVGWVNILVLRLGDIEYRLLMTMDALES